MDEYDVDQTPGLAKMLLRFFVISGALAGLVWIFYRGLRPLFLADADFFTLLSVLGFFGLAGATALLFFLIALQVYPVPLVSQHNRQRLVKSYRKLFRPSKSRLAAFMRLLDALFWTIMNMLGNLAKAGGLLFESFLGQEVPVIWVKEGRIEPKLSQDEGLSGGMALVDLDSAIVLERQWKKSLFGWVAPGKNRTASPFKLSRVRRNGVTFIKWNEKLRGVVSLRKQFRINMTAKACTSDGIEVQARVFTIFTLGQPATVIKVAYVGELRPENLRVIQVDEATRTIKSIQDDLDAQDRQEIHSYAAAYLDTRKTAGQANRLLNAHLAPAESHKEYPPFLVDEERISAAIYYQGRGVGDDQPKVWSELPLYIATEVFHNVVAQVKYDDFYAPEDKNPDNYPIMKVYKPAFAKELRYMGVMSYQFIHRRDDQPPEVGQVIDNSHFYVAEVQKLVGSKVLRDCGIKLIHAAFSELTPNELVKQQRLDNWRARWQQKAERVKADAEREVMQVRALARAEKQREMVMKLSEIMKSSDLSEDALTLRVLQVLEDVAADPNTRQLLPTATLDLLYNFQLWLEPGQERLSALQEGLLRTNRIGR